MAENCPSCDTNPLGESYRVELTTMSGAELEAVLCGSCGIVYVEDAGKMILRAHDIRAGKDAAGGPDGG